MELATKKSLLGRPISGELDLVGYLCPSLGYIYANKKVPCPKCMCWLARLLCEVTLGSEVFCHGSIPWIV